MELYETIAAWIGWPAITALLVISGIVTYFRVRNRPDLQKERIEWFEQQIEATKDYRPDILAQRLAERLRILQQEIEKLEVDQKVRALVIHQKEIELSQVKIEIEELANRLVNARDLLKVISDRQLACPYCGAALVSHEIHPDIQLYQGSEVDIAHETTAYECGYEIRDGIIVHRCKNTSPDDFPQ